MSSPNLEMVIEQIEQLSSEDKQKLLEYLQDEIAYEESLLDSVLDGLVDESGVIDFDTLYQRGKSAQALHEDFPDEIDADGHIGEIDA